MSMPGDEFNGLGKRLEQCGELGKPVIVGEAGVKPPDVGGTLAARDQAFASKLLRQIPAGVAGFVPWAWNREGSSLVTFDIGPGDPVLQTLAAFGDYDSAAGSLTFAPGETSKTVTVKVNGDLLDEPDETFFVNASNPVNATIADGQGLGTIQDDDAEPALSIDDVVVTEGDAGQKTASFTVSLSTASGKTVTTAFATSSGTATQGVDFDSAGGTLTFDPGQTTKTIAVSINGDTDVEPDETYNVDLSSPTNASVTDGHGVGTIANDDNAPIANDDSATTSEDTPVLVDVLANDTDADGDTLTIDSFTQPEHGTVTQVGSELRYTPNAGFTGTDSFTYKASDGAAESNPATVTITVIQPLPPGCTKGWAAEVDGFWSDETKWTPAGVPTATDDVCLTGGGYTVTVEGTQSAGSVTLGAAGNLERPTLLITDSPVLGVGAVEQCYWFPEPRSRPVREPARSWRCFERRGGGVHERC